MRPTEAHNRFIWAGFAWGLRSSRSARCVLYYNTHLGKGACRPRCIPPAGWRYAPMERPAVLSPLGECPPTPHSSSIERATPLLLDLDARYHILKWTQIAKLGYLECLRENGKKQAYLIKTGPISTWRTWGRQSKYARCARFERFGMSTSCSMTTIQRYFELVVCVPAIWKKTRWAHATESIHLRISASVAKIGRSVRRGKSRQKVIRQ